MANGKQSIEIEIEKVVIPEKRAKATLTQEQYEELKENIRQHGFTIPILVKRISDEKYELIDGEHRIRICNELGYNKVPAIIIEADEKKATILNITSNTLRGTQDHLTISEALNKALENGATLEELASAWGKSTLTTKLYLSLIKLPDVYKEALRQQRLLIGHVQQALRLPIAEEQDYCLSLCLKLGWPVSTCRTYVERRLAEIKAAEERAKELNEPPKIPEPDADKLLSYEECFHCKRKVPKNSVYMHLVCHDCKSLLSWILENLPDPVKAMDYIYKALQRQLEYEKYLELRKKFEEEEKSLRPQPSSEVSSPLPSENEEKTGS